MQPPKNSYGGVVFFKPDSSPLRKVFYNFLVHPWLEKVSFLWFAIMMRFVTLKQRQFMWNSSSWNRDVLCWLMMPKLIYISVWDHSKLKGDAKSGLTYDGAAHRVTDAETRQNIRIRLAIFSVWKSSSKIGQEGKFWETQFRRIVLWQIPWGTICTKTLLVINNSRYRAHLGLDTNRGASACRAKTFSLREVRSGLSPLLSLKYIESILQVHQV